MTWRPQVYPFGTASEKLEAFRRHAEIIVGSGMSEERAWKVYQDAGIKEIAIVRDWFVFLGHFDPMELPRVPDYSVVKPFKLFCGEIVVDGRGRDLGSCYITTYMQLFDEKTFATANTLYLLVGEGGIVSDYGAVLREVGNVIPKAPH